MRTTVLIVPLLVASAALAAAARVEVSLNGEWEHQLVEELKTPPGGGEWKRCEVPGYLRGHDYKRAWLRRAFAVPEAMKGQRIKLRFGGVKYNSRVFVNGKHVGGCFGGYRPFELDITNAVRFGKPNELAVGVHDWTGVFTSGPKVDFTKKKEWNRIRSIPRDRILAPIGGLYALYGIWDDVTLRSHPAVYIKDVFIKPSVRQKQLVVDYALANESRQDAEVELAAAVEEHGGDGGQVALRLPKLRVRVPAGKTAMVTVKAGWPKPRLWSHVDPYLYRLRTELRGVPGDPPAGLKPAGGAADVVRTRFGFREFWVEGHRFTLNGVPVNLLATSWWPPHAPMTREQIKERWLAIKKANCIVFRTHTQPWRRVHYEVADEIGLLMIPEGAIWNDDAVYRVNDPAFWDNYAKHLKSMVDNLYNPPSVVMWSLENEFTGGRMNDNTPGPKAQLARMGKLVKQWDPTRPIFYESDGDPNGVADAIGIHYPHEYPSYTAWPNEAWWLDKPSRGHGGGGFFLNGEPHFLWKKDKPLYIGEFLWLPSSNPSWHTVFFGDEAYADYRRYRLLGKAESWKMQIIAYRCQDVAGISPWTMIEGGKLDESNLLWRAHQYAYQPIAAYCLDYDARFTGGEKVTRRVEVFNDSMQTRGLKLSWALSVGGAVVERGEHAAFRYPPAHHRMEKILLRIPLFPKRVAGELRLTVTADGKQMFEDVRRCSIFPKPTALAASARPIGLFDPNGATRKLFKAHGVRCRAVGSLSKLPPELNVLVIGTRAFEASAKNAPVIGQVAPERKGLLDFVQRGGRLLVLEQEAYPEGLFDFVLTGQKSTMTFPARPQHPALRGVELDDLKFWRGDHVVAEREPPRPATGGYVPIVVSGSRAGVASAPLLERRIGKGCILFSQLKLVEKFDQEPAAAQILNNVLRYLADYRPSVGRTAVVGGSKAYHDTLRGLGLRFDDLTGKLGEADLRPYSLVVCRGKVDALAKLRQFVEAGGNVVFHRTPVGAPVEAVCKAFGISLTFQPYSGHAVRAEGTDPLVGKFLREDLYWLGKHMGIGWSTTPLATGVADAAIGKKIDAATARSFEAEDWNLEGHIVEKRGPGVAFATVGSVTGEVLFPASGTYVIGLVARGTPCYGVYPQASITIGGRRFGTVIASDEQWRTYTAFGHVEKGRHPVKVAFTNDASNPPEEDRNLYLDKILIARDKAPTDVTFITSPPTVAIVRRGKGLVVLDQMRWDTEARNARKAARYAATLLTELGGDFASRSGVAIECETMKPQEGMAHYRAAGSTAHLACSGYVGAKVQISAAGRYTMVLVASGTEAEGIYPHVEVTLDDQPIGEVQLTSGGWRSYPVTVELPKGEHELRIHFTNDLQIPGVADRNLALDKVVFYRE